MLSIFILFSWTIVGQRGNKQMPASIFSIDAGSSAASPLPCREWTWWVLWWLVFGGPVRWAWCPLDRLPSPHHRCSGRILNTAYWQISLLMLITQHVIPLTDYITCKKVWTLKFSTFDNLVITASHEATSKSKTDTPCISIPFYKRWERHFSLIHYLPKTLGWPLGHAC